MEFLDGLFVKLDALFHAASGKTGQTPTLGPRSPRSLAGDAP